jgi:hypothetical protein
MRPEALVSSPRGWTILLADMVALMLAFFVLAFSMRELGRAGWRGIRAGRHGPALAVQGEGRLDELAAPEMRTAVAPPLAYLAAIIEGSHASLSADRIRHDDAMLSVDLPAGRSMPVASWTGMAVTCCSPSPPSPTASISSSPSRAALATKRPWQDGWRRHGRSATGSPARPA